tara:strand:- start:2025 stop:2675 length:651 start_codon:yes stop_codon:yes gene_type:complete
MATFAQMLARFKASQSLAEKLDKASLGIAGAEEKQALADARRDYEIQVEEAQRQMKKDAKKRSIRSFLGGTALTALGVATGQPKLLTAAMGTVGSYAGAGSVPSYEQYIDTTVGRGLFYAGAKKDLRADIAATNQFIQDAGDSQNLANIINAVSFGTQAYMGYDTLLDLKSDFKDLMKGLGGDAPLYDGIDTGTTIDTGDIMSPASILETQGSVGV